MTHPRRTKGLAAAALSSMGGAQSLRWQLILTAFADDRGSPPDQHAAVSIRVETVNAAKVPLRCQVSHSGFSGLLTSPSA